MNDRCPRIANGFPQAKIRSAQDMVYAVFLEPGNVCINYSKTTSAASSFCHADELGRAHTLHILLCLEALTARTTTTCYSYFYVVSTLDYHPRFKAKKVWDWRDETTSP